MGVAIRNESAKWMARYFSVQLRDNALTVLALRCANAHRRNGHVPIARKGCGVPATGPERIRRREGQDAAGTDAIGAGRHRDQAKRTVAADGLPVADEGGFAEMRRSEAEGRFGEAEPEGCASIRVRARRETHLCARDSEVGAFPRADKHHTSAPPHHAHTLNPPPSTLHTHTRPRTQTRCGARE